MHQRQPHKMFIKEISYFALAEQYLLGFVDEDGFQDTSCIM